MEHKKNTVQKVGTVVSLTKDQKTAKVELVTIVQHPKYHKRMKRLSYVHAHAAGPCQIGDSVLLRHVRPLSKIKHWLIEQKVVGVKS